MKSENRRLIILLVILAVVLTYYLWSIGLFSRDTVETDLTVEIEPSTAPHFEPPTDLRPKKIEDYSGTIKEFRFDGSWVRDPFYYYDSDSLRAARGEYGLSNMRLTGISLRKGSDYSLVNTMMFTETDTIVAVNILKEGDKLGDFRIEKIAFDYIILRQGNQKMRLTLYEEQ
jgi:hypothetical protein